MNSGKGLGQLPGVALLPPLEPRGERDLGEKDVATHAALTPNAPQCPPCAGGGTERMSNDGIPPKVSSRLHPLPPLAIGGMPVLARAMRVAAEGREARCGQEVAAVRLALVPLIDGQPLTPVLSPSFSSPLASFPLVGGQAAPTPSLARFTRFLAAPSADNLLRASSIESRGVIRRILWGHRFGSSTLSNVAVMRHGMAPVTPT